jgi:hypothetical protein
MRTGYSGVRSKNAIATVAVTSTATISPAVITERFETLGFIVTEETTSSRTRRDRAVVFTAVRLDTNADTSLTLIATYALNPVMVPKASFQPVWNVSRWCSTGLELLVLNDTDACAQLDALSEALDVQRDSITIKPRVGWQGYGHARTS